MEIFRADKNTSESLFSRLSELDIKCVGADGWSALSFKSEAEKDNGIVLYAVENGEVTGLICGYFASDEADITSVAVDPHNRRKGIASQLLSAFLDALPNITNCIFLEVRESNSSAIGLYKKFEFERLSIRKNFYSSPDENAIVMQKILKEEG